MVAKLRPSQASVPDHVWLQKFGGGAAPPDHTYLTGGHLGMAYAPMLLGRNHDDNPATPGFRVRAFEGIGKGAIAEAGENLPGKTHSGWLSGAAVI